jgi:hypothetical protein
MKSILIQKNNNKFINNLELCASPFDKHVVAETRGELYKLYQIDRFSHIILNYSLISAEELQFIKDYGSETNIYIYNDIESQIEGIDKIKAILEHSKQIKHTNKSIKIPTLINSEIFYSSKIDKSNTIVCYLDNINELPSSLTEYLYPKNKLPIKLFNNANIIHPQNLGLLSEKAKALMLQQSRYYLALNDYYVPEAWACDCEVLNIDDLKNLQSSQYKFSKKFQSYSNFLKVLQTNE